LSAGEVRGINAIVAGVRARGKKSNISDLASLVHAVDGALSAAVAR